MPFHIKCFLTGCHLLPFQNKTKQNKTKQNKTKQNKTKQNKTKQNKTKQNKTKHSLSDGRNAIQCQGSECNRLVDVAKLSGAAVNRNAQM